MDTSEQKSLFYEILDASLPRLGPGDDAATVRALDVLRSAPPGSPAATVAPGLTILDIGCGNGPQTLVLARRLDAAIVALDNHRPCLDELERRARTQGLDRKIRTRLGDMNDLGPGDGAFDLVWSEGALYVLGFHHGLEVCHTLLAPGGGLAVTELCWLRPDAPDECRRFFEREYPAIAGVETHLAAIGRCGFEVLGHFSLPESAWWKPYYHPLQDRLQTLRVKYAADPERLAIIESVQAEIDLYRRFSDFYGYVFFVMRRR